jgi:hypothetical protein
MTLNHEQQIIQDIIDFKIELNKINPFSHGRIKFISDIASTNWLSISADQMCHFRDLMGVVDSDFCPANTITCDHKVIQMFVDAVSESASESMIVKFQIACATEKSPWFEIPINRLAMLNVAPAEPECEYA